MKNFTVIQQQIVNLKERKTELEAVHSKMDQISMLSGEGSLIRAEINQTKGEIKALEWVVNDQINGEL